MNMIQFHIGNSIKQETFKKLGTIRKLSGDSFEIQVVFDSGHSFYYYLEPIFNWMDNTPDFLMIDGNVYSEMDLYTFCTNWITEDLLNILETSNG